MDRCGRSWGRLGYEFGVEFEREWFVCAGLVAQDRAFAGAIEWRPLEQMACSG